MGHTQLFAGAPFESGYRFAEDKLLRIKYMADRVQQFLVQRTVLALQVQHGHGLGCLGRRNGWDGWDSWIYGGFHLFILPAAYSSFAQPVPHLAGQNQGGEGAGKDRKLKRLRNKYNVI
jgi:hypothetical protein